MNDCCCFNTDGTPLRNVGSDTSHASKPQSRENGHDSVTFAQFLQAELKKALHKTLHKRKKHCAHDSDSDNDSDYILKSWVG